MTNNSHKELLIPFLIGDTLLIAAVLFVVLKSGKLTAEEWALAAACLAGSLFFFVKGIRTAISRRKPKSDDRWKPIEP